MSSPTGIRIKKTPFLNWDLKGEAIEFKKFYGIRFKSAVGGDFGADFAEYRWEEIEANDIVLDIGATEGLYSLLAAWRGAKKVYASDPLFQKELKENLERNVELAKRIEILDYGFGFEGMYEDAWERKRKISAHRDLLSFIGEHPDLSVLKIDCEGCEWGAFARLENFRKLRMISFEAHIYSCSHKQMWEVLRQRFSSNGFLIATQDSKSPSVFLVHATR